MMLSINSTLPLIRQLNIYNMPGNKVLSEGFRQRGKQRTNLLDVPDDVVKRCGHIHCPKRANNQSPSVALTETDLNSPCCNHPISSVSSRSSGS